MKKKKHQKNSKPRVSIVFPNWNGKDDTIECLKSLQELNYPKELLEIVIVDNGSEDGSQKEIKNFFTKMKSDGWKRLYLVENDENLGAAIARNKGIINTDKDSDYIWLTDNDIVADKDALQILIDTAEKDSSIGMAGSKNYYFDFEGKKDVIWYAGAEVKWWAGTIDHNQIGKVDTFKDEEPRETDYIAGSSMLIRKKLLDDVGLFDETYFVYCNDTDLSLRFNRAGYKVVYVPKSVIWHKVGSTTGRFSPFSIFYHTRNRFWLIKRNYSLLQYLLFIISFLFIKHPYWLLRFILRREGKQIVSFYKAILQGIFVSETPVTTRSE